MVMQRLSRERGGLERQLYPASATPRGYSPHLPAGASERRLEEGHSGAVPLHGSAVPLLTNGACTQTALNTYVI
jgi:hypothetical protein